MLDRPRNRNIELFQMVRTGGGRYGRRRNIRRQMSFEIGFRLADCQMEGRGDQWNTLALRHMTSRRLSRGECNISPLHAAEETHPLDSSGPKS